MATVASANLVGITGIARRLVLDGNLDEASAREALDAASQEKRPVAGYLLEKKLVSRNWCASTACCRCSSAAAGCSWA